VGKFSLLFLVINARHAFFILEAVYNRRAMKMMALTEQAISLIRKSGNIVALSGAGISTEAGIPDFRGPGGMWEEPGLMDQLSVSGFRNSPETFYRTSVRLFSNIARAEPTPAHRLLVRLEQLNKLKAVITQNIDGLHTAAGSTKVFELHGTYRTGHCPQCGTEFEMAEFYAEIERGNLRVPLCTACAVPIKPDIVLFEDLLPVNAWNGAVQAATTCDLMLIFGSSLMVYPAAELPMIAFENGARLVIVNLGETSYDNMAAVAIKSRLGDFAKTALATFME
jgi:NAD-dependent deacetylase